MSVSNGLVSLVSSGTWPQLLFRKGGEGRGGQRRLLAAGGLSCSSVVEVWVTQVSALVSSAARVLIILQFPEINKCGVLTSGQLLTSASDVLFSSAGKDWLPIVHKVKETIS